MMYHLKDLLQGSEDFEQNKEGRAPFSLEEKKRVTLLALGDVGGTLLTGFKLLGSDVISTIGIYDPRENVALRFEAEMNQMAYPWDYDALPAVEVIDKEQLFDGDVFVFCASKAVPAIGAEGIDVRMVQFEGNREIIKEYARMARQQKFKGLFAVVSDPVDPLCKVVYLESNKDEEGNFDGKGLKPDQIQGYGLGVMNSRAAYFAKKEERFQSFLTEGRAFGPHGQGLVIANSIEGYDDDVSRALTQLTVEANLKTRALGFKPFMAPAISSGAISLLLTLRGEWHYSSNYLGEVFFGAKNKMTEKGVVFEDLSLPEPLFARIKASYEELKQIV